ncbi:MAG: hypothetical protein ACKVP3_07075 [Hyphomicrobiaceae bacterium]
MVRAYLFAASIYASSTAALMGASVGSVASAGEPILNLAGRWAGDGTVIPASGPSETFKCVITYFPSNDGARIKQNLRCKGVSYSFDAATHLQIAGAQVTGQWNDNIYSLSGTVTGTLTENGFDILLSGRYFEARMRVVSSNCEQSVTVVPERKDEMKELAAVLKKC